MKFVNVPCKPGAEENRANYVPFPPGPYILVAQFTETRYEKCSWQEAIDTALSSGDKIFVEFDPMDLSIGWCLFANLEGRAKIVAYYWDSSG